MTAIILTIGCIAGFVVAWLFVFSLCSIAAASDRRMEELLRDGHEHF